MLTVWMALALAKTPVWVKEQDGTTEVCAIPVDGDPNLAKPPALTTLQTMRRERTVQTESLWPPVQATGIAKKPVGLKVEASTHPVREGWSLVRVELGTPANESTIEQHVTIAVDTTDSMYSATLHGVPLLQDEPPPERGSYRSVSRLEFVRESLHELVDSLEGAERTVAIVVFRGGNATELAAPTPVAEKAVLHAAIDRIREESVGESELFETIFRTAAKAFTACADDRVLLLTDDNPRFQGDPADVMEGLSAWAGQGLRLQTFAVGATTDLTPIAKLSAAGGGTLRRIDTMSEAASGYIDALRPTGAVLIDPALEVTFEGEWRSGGKAGTGSDVWTLPKVLTSEWTGVRMYEVASSKVGVRVEVTPLIDSFGPVKMTAFAAKPVPFDEASAAFRHAAAYALVDSALHDPTQMSATSAALETGIREVGPGREAQALLEMVR